MWKAGHSLIKHKLKQENAALTGEMSGHVFFNDRYFGFDDAIDASFRQLEIASREGRGLGAMMADLPHSESTPEIRVECAMIGSVRSCTMPPLAFAHAMGRLRSMTHA
jgi:phosphomannomutase/phosphoglucomutase